jgi:hypothetical protein
LGEAEIGDDLEELANPPIALWSNVETDRIPEKAVEINVNRASKIDEQVAPAGVLCCLHTR